MYRYMAERCTELGHIACIVLPPNAQCVDTFDTPAAVVRSTFTWPLCNARRRFHWDLNALLVWKPNLLITGHETLAYPVKQLLPEVRVVSDAGGKLTGAAEELIRLARIASDAIHCNSELIAKRMEHKQKFVWKFGYYTDLLRPRNLKRDIDVLFNARCSSTNYSHHKEMLEACELLLLQGKKVVFTDPTSYLGHPPLSCADYQNVLHRSKVVVGLTDNEYGGFAFQEAVACGACPVALRSFEYEEVLGKDWPFYCSLDPKDIASTVLRADWQAVWTPRVHELQNRIGKCSYTAAWKQAKEDLCL